ncbi:hypothetical protein [Robiginitalea sp.]|uniref:hypothetical protein n=1 Tax=Robiginitalea sp. TaxID=1902411 RepID=UPI003C69C567
MAPVDFEKDLQERLRSREVQPREDSWDRIEARLEAETPARKPGSGKWKYLVAASVVFLLGFFLLQETTVDEPTSDAIVESPETGVPETKDIPETKEASKLIKGSGVPLSDSRNPVVMTDKEDQNPMDRKTRSDVNVTSTDIAVTGEYNKSLTQADLSDRSLADLTPEVQDDLKIPDTEWVTSDTNREDGIDDAEVDALLSEALQVVENKGVPRDSTSLNPAALLGEVESELDQTFREQILKKLKTGFSKVRTAVADRSQ